MNAGALCTNLWSGLFATTSCTPVSHNNTVGDPTHTDSARPSNIAGRFILSRC